MKAIKLLATSFILCSLQSIAQSNQSDNLLVGTWMKDNDTLKEIKILSPTHVFFINFNNKDSFMYAGAGTYRTEGNEYIEGLQHGNLDWKSIQGFIFDYKVKGDTFLQRGTLILPEGPHAPINHTFIKVKSEKYYEGPHVGTWNQLSSTYTDEQGNKHSHTNETHIRFDIITPTHWARIGMVDNLFENAMTGTYTIDGDKMYMKIVYASFPIDGETVELTPRFEGNKVYWSGIVKDARGKEISRFEDIAERVIVK